MKRAIILLAVASLAALAACSKDETVTSSEVLDTGLEATPRVTTSDEKTVLEYESWIEVDRITTRAPKQYTVTLRNEFSAQSIVTWDSSFNFYPLEQTLLLDPVTHPQDHWSKGNDITLWENHLYVTFDGGFMFPLLFQSAVYDDGVTQQELPYHAIESVSLGNYNSSDLGTEKQDDGILYEGKKRTYSMNITCGGKVYTSRLDYIIWVPVTTD